VYLVLSDESMSDIKSAVIVSICPVIDISAMVKLIGVKSEILHNGTHRSQTQSLAFWR